MRGATGGSRAFYDHYWTDGYSPTDVKLPKELEALLAKHVSPDTLALDVGCGDGSKGGPWLNTHAAKYVGVDVSEVAVKLAQDRGLDARTIEDAETLPFSNASFDLVLSSEVLEHLLNPMKAAIEALRVLRPGGVFVMTVPNIAHWRIRVPLALWGEWNAGGDSLSASEPWRDPHLRFFTVASARSFLTTSGFTVEEAGGFDEHGVLARLPAIRRLRSHSARLDRWLIDVFPTLMAARIYGVGRRPAAD